MTASKTKFKHELDQKLRSKQLQIALDRALPAFRERRAHAMEEVDWPALRADLTARRQSAVDHQPELLERFTREAEAVGAKVYRAADAAEARRLVAGLLKERKARLAVKSKSMATEEIHLNEHLEHEGIKVVETDLGEWILQLAHERPSHLIAPAIHKTREEIAKLLSKEAGRALPPDIDQLVAVARERLREAFLKADVGITGGNALIAETGTLMLVTNEGNADLATSLPPVHIAVVGIDKVVATLEDATAMLKLLPRSATGQKITSYVQFITGPSRSADIELTLAIGVHGPKELHIVLLDNGRTAMRADPAFREALRCVRCGACSNVCPSYQVVGGHIFGHIYTGPIGLVVSPWHHGIESVAYEQSMCVGCNACDTVCPVEIPLASLITDVRAKAVEKTGLALSKRIGLGMWSTREGMARLFEWGSVLQRPFLHDGGVRPPLLGALTREKSLPPIAATPLHVRAHELATHNPDPALTRVALFPSCLVDRLLPEAGYAAARVLQELGADVRLAYADACCGLPHLNSGDRDHAVEMARRAIERLEGVDADWIVAPSSSCAITVAQDYARILDGEWRERAARLGERVLAFTAFADRLYQRRPVRGRPLGLRATYHDACQSANVLGLHDEARRLLREVASVEVVEMAESSVCCGFGGSFSFEYPEVATRILDRKLANASATGVDVILTDNPGCLTHLRGGLQARGMPMRVAHLAEVLWESLRK